MSPTNVIDPLCIIVCPGTMSHWTRELKLVEKLKVVPVGGLWQWRLETSMLPLFLSALL